jgi:FHA domain
MTLQVYPGTGFVTHSTGVVAAVVPIGPDQAALARVLLELVEHTAPTEGPRLVQHAVATISDSISSLVPPFCILAADHANMLLLAHGALDLTIVRAGGETERIAADAGGSWIERIIELPIESIEVIARGLLPVARDDRLDLRSGVVAGSGFLLGGSRQPAVGVPSDELDMARDQPEPELASDGVGVAADVGVADAAVDDTPPPIGYLVFDDGATFNVDRNYVIGRDPHDHPEVQAGRASPLPLGDPTRDISRHHAMIRLQGDRVTLADQHSTNGTFVAQPGERDWSGVDPDRPVTLRPGAQVLIGRRTLVFDSHLH